MREVQECQPSPDLETEEETLTNLQLVHDRQQLPNKHGWINPDSKKLGKQFVVGI